MKLLENCVIVASNKRQAVQIRECIAARLEAGLYPREIAFHVFADPDRGRVGSGGATILAAHEMRDRLLRGEAVLVINAGGESRRMPSYAPEGKLFAPLPLPSSSTIPAVLLDMQLGLFLRYPWNEGEMVVTAGDVAIDFDADLVPEQRGEIYSFAKSDSFELGSRHGVFKFNRNRSKVIDFFQKESVGFLREQASLEGSRSCALDLGIVGFSSKGLERIFTLATAPFPGGRTLLELLREARAGMDLYVELVMAFLSDVPLQRYREKVRSYSNLEPAVLDSIHSAFRDVDFRAFLTKRTRFLHFGSLREYPLSCEELASSGVLPFYAGDDAELRPLVSEAVIQVNSIDSHSIPRLGARHIYMESCCRALVESAGGQNLLLGLTDCSFAAPLPAGVCIDQRRSALGRFFLVYSVEDTWLPQRDIRSLVFCGISLDRWLSDRQIDSEHVYPSSRAHDAPSYDLWDAQIFVAEEDARFAEGYWNLESAGAEWRDRFLAGDRRSIREITAAERLWEREERRAGIREDLLREGISHGHGWLSVSDWDFRKALDGADIGVLQSICNETDDDLLRVYRQRLIDSLFSNRGSEDLTSGLYIDYLSGSVPPNQLKRSVKRDQIVWARSPVRLDLAGGWTDTPPFTLREGGEVVNVAANINDQPPIQVFCRPTNEQTIRIHSIDLGVGETIRLFSELEDYDAPSSPFALPKAAFCLLGFTAEKALGSNLAAELDRVGGGLELSLLSAVPKGSGLGTSSILAATILGALERFFGLKVERDELFRQVLQIEQMLTTGGGWQDQIGGVSGGVKYIASAPGLKPNPVVYQLDPFIFEDPGLSALFTLYYTGITRLAKNILQEVVDRVNTMEPAYLFTMRYLKRLARSARESVSRRDVIGLGRVLNASWQANKLVHPSTTNDEVESLTRSVNGLYAGLKFLGAGGGGYILFLSESEDQARALRGRLSSLEHECARLVDMRINQDGLRVTVS